MRVFLAKSFCDDGVSFEKKIRVVVVDTQMPKNRRNTALFIYYMSYLLSYSFCRFSLSLSLSLFLYLYLSRAVSSLLGIARERNCFRFALSRLFLLRRARRKRERRFFFFFRNFRDLFFLLFGDRVVANAY